MKTVHIFDIDTTIADNTRRAQLLQKICVVCLSSKPVGFNQACPACNRDTRSHIEQAALDRFFDEDQVIQDLPVLKAQQFITRLRTFGSEIHFLTGRDHTLRNVTSTWLKTHFGRDESPTSAESLIMRGYREISLNASVYKEQAFLALKQTQKYDSNTLFLFYEDDPHVLAMYGRHGIVVKCPEAWDYLMPDAPRFEETPFAVS